MEIKIEKKLLDPQCCTCIYAPKENFSCLQKLDNFLKINGGNMIYFHPFLCKTDSISCKKSILLFFIDIFLYQNYLCTYLGAFFTLFSNILVSDFLWAYSNCLWMNIKKIRAIVQKKGGNRNRNKILLWSSQLAWWSNVRFMWIESSLILTIDFLMGT